MLVNLAMVLPKKTSRNVRTCKFFAWLSRNRILARFSRRSNHDMARYIKYFLTYLDEIVRRTYQGDPRNISISSSWQDGSSFARVNKILHGMASCIKFRFTGIFYNVLQKTILLFQYNL